MSTKLPWPTRVFVTAKSSMVTVITIGSSYLRSITLKSWSVKVMGGILLGLLVYVWCTACTFLRCFFLAEVDEPPLANQPAIVLITTRTGVPLQPCHLGDRERLVLYLRHWSLEFLLGLLMGLLLGLLPKLLPLWFLYGDREISPRMNLRKCPAWMSSFILSFRAQHSSVLWP